MSTTIFDIDTGRLPLTELEASMPPFDESEVKLGNLKDEAKIAAKLEWAQVKHRQDYIERAALDPMTGKILAIGEMDAATGQPILYVGSENTIINQFWDSIRIGGGAGVQRIAGFNIRLFDLPFLCRRSYHHGIPIPTGLFDGRYWHKNVVDLRDWWQLGDRTVHGSMDRICKFLDLGEKTGSGKDFAALFESDREAALDYLTHDLELTRALARRLGVA